MAENASARKKPDAREVHSLTGTFVCVLLLGGFIALTWLGVLILFIHRM